MQNFVESASGKDMVAQERSQKQDYWYRDGGGPVRAEWTPVLDYEGMTAYIRLWPDKLAAFVSQRLADDDMRFFARELYEYICVGDADGPEYEEWRNT